MLNKLFIILLGLFLVLFTFKATINMATIPFHDFDEAHRAEKAKRMKEYVSFLIPLTGSPHDRTNDLRIPLRENHDLFLYYHPERPPLVYWLMIISTSIFGQSEWAYRLPSLLMMAATIFTLVLFIFLFRSKVAASLIISLTVILTSYDLWLSGQYAQLDTTLTFFLFISLLSLLIYIEKRTNQFLLISGISFSLAILSKGQPTVIFLFPLLYLVFSKKLTLREFGKFWLYAGIILLPWLMLLAIYFDLGKFLKIFTHFAASSATIEYSHISAPIYWYARWWWDSFRPGLSLFLSLLAVDLLRKNLDTRKKVLLSFILGGFLFFSISINKLWWYILPLIPAVTYYIYLSSSEYLQRNKHGLINLALVVCVTSLPIFLWQSNTISLTYGMIITAISFVILLYNFSFLNPLTNVIFLSSVAISLIVFYTHFPTILPYHKNTKFVAEYFKSLPGKKCLYIKDMPSETALFYSSVGEIIPLTENRSILGGCENYLITPEDFKKDELIYYFSGQKYSLKDREILYQRGTIKLIRL